MKKFKHILTAFLALNLLFLMSCKDDSSEVIPTSNFETLTTYMVNNDLDLPDVLNGWIVGPPAEADVNTFIASYDILDLRSSSDFSAGRIQGAMNTTLGTLLNDAASTSKPILIVCYTGQTAGHAVTALRLSGYSDAKVLKWGMSGWNSNFSGPWAGNSGDNGNIGVSHAGWSTSGPLPAENFGFPSLTSSSTNPATILEERVDMMLTNGFKGTPSSDVLSNSDQFFINNYWAQTDVDHYGIIDGSYRIQPLSIAGGQLKNLDPSKTVVTYCWTGQTSSMITAYLNVLGYQAQSLKFGANSMIYSELESHKFVTPTVDLPIVTD
ncbi:MAG: rhodanese-like domain-containing protein [Cyclobacteriaceae bacterium]